MKKVESTQGAPSTVEIISQTNKHAKSYSLGKSTYTFILSHDMEVVKSKY